MAIKFKHKPLVAAVTLWATLSLFSPSTSAEYERGQALYENHCRFCHESWKLRVLEIASPRLACFAYVSRRGVSTRDWVGATRRSTMSQTV